MKVLINVPLSPYSGYGNDGIGIARALIKMGADVYLDPSVVQTPIPADVAHLLTKENVAPFDLAICHLDPASLHLDPEVRANAKICIAWTMWEYSNLLNLPGRTKLKKKLKDFDAIVGYDRVSSECFEPYFDGPVFTVQGGFWPEDWPEVERDWNEKNFYFCMVGMLTGRKDPWPAIQAFSELKHELPEEFEPARLSLKTMTPGLHSAMEDVYPGLRIYYEAWSTEKLRAFYASQHVMISTSRGEGKNMPALEFQSTGGVVIATNWGGHQMWLHPAYSYPLDVTMAPVDEKTPNTLNARADVQHLKTLMLHVFRNRNEAHFKGTSAAQAIPAQSSWITSMSKLFEKLRTVEGGERLWTLRCMLEAPDENG